MCNSQLDACMYDEFRVWEICCPDTGLKLIKCTSLCWLFPNESELSCQFGWLFCQYTQNMPELFTKWLMIHEESTSICLKYLLEGKVLDQNIHTKSWGSCFNLDTATIKWNKVVKGHCTINLDKLWLLSFQRQSTQHWNMVWEKSVLLLFILTAAKIVGMLYLLVVILLVLSC